MYQPLKPCYEFGPFRLDATERLLLRDGTALSLTPKAFDLLVVLIAQPQHLLTKEELMQAVWPDTIVEESNLSSNIALIRKALGDGENGERYIETVPRRGYRFVNQVREVSSETALAAESLVTVTALQVEELQVAVPATVQISSNGNMKLPPQAADKMPVRRERNWKIATGVFALLTLLALGVAYFKRSATEPRALRLAFVPPENLTFENGQHDYVRVSPDGKMLVFTGQAADSSRRLWVRAIDSMEATPLPETEGAIEPFWSPDSRSIGFVANWKMKRVDLAGGRPQVICDAFNVQGVTWNRTGVILYAWEGSNGLYQVPATGGEPQRVTSTDPARGESEHRYPWFLPDGRHFLFRVTGGVGGVAPRIYVGSLDSKKVRQVLADASAPVFVPPGWLFFVRNGALMAQSFDAERIEPKGEAIKLTPPTDTPMIGGLAFSVSENSIVTWQGSRRQKHQLIWFDREGNQRGVVGPINDLTSGQLPRFSPDGKHVAINRNEPQTRNQDVWVIDLASHIPVRLTSDPDLDWSPIWSPDGSRVAFQALRTGAMGIYQKAANGIGADELLMKGRGNTSDWSADGRFIFYVTRGSMKLRRNIWVLPLFGDRQPYEIVNSEFDEHTAHLSPDGRWLAYVADDSDSYEIYVQTFTAEGKVGGDRKRISINGGNCPRWRRDGKELFYIAADGQMMAVKFNGASFEKPQALFKTRLMMGLTGWWADYDVTPDGQRFLIGTLVGTPAPVSVILNWTAEMKK